MKTLSQKITYLLVLSFLMAAVEVNADLTTQTLTQPMSYCFLQDEYEYANNQLTYTHYLQIPQADQFKNGYVFVGFRFRNKPENVWLETTRRPDRVLISPVVQPIQPIVQPSVQSSIYFGGNYWLQYSSGNSPTFFTGGSLQPVIRLPILNQQSNVTAIENLYAQDPNSAGEILVGYGLDAGTGNPVMNAYQDMISNNKFYVAWVLGGSIYVSANRICLIASQVTSEYVGLNTTLQ